MMGLAETMSLLKGEKDGGLVYMKNYITGNYPNVIRAIRIIDLGNTNGKRGRGYNLMKRENKKQGFLYYVRFYHEGRMLPSSWCTHTNNLQVAEKFAIENKARLIEAYLKKHDPKMFLSLEKFYSDENPESSYLSERCKYDYNKVIINNFIPFLKDKKITSFGQITTGVLAEFQETVQAKGVKPQTVNNTLKPVRGILEYLSRKGTIKENPANFVKGVPTHQKDREARGCYEPEKIKGVFNKRWKDKTSQILSLLIYSTGMRNSEIKRLRMEDIITMEGCRFIRVKESKTANGIRLVPLHSYVYKKLAEWAARNKKDSVLFDYKRAAPFCMANSCLGEKLGLGWEEIKAEHITFYSGRHFWKTLMSSEGLGEDIEEIFMGHKVSSNVAKLYNHKDKIGKKNMVKKAKQVFLRAL